MKLIPFLLVVAALVPAVLSDDLKTKRGEEYKNISINRTEPDGLVVSHAAGIVKIPFTELSEEIQQKYHYDPKAAAEFAAKTAAAQQALYEQTQAAQRRAVKVDEVKSRNAASIEKSAAQQLTAAALRELNSRLDKSRFGARANVLRIESDTMIFGRIDVGKPEYERENRGLDVYTVAKWYDFGDQFYSVSRRKLENWPADLQHRRTDSFYGYVTGIDTRSLLTDEAIFVELYEMGTIKSGGSRHRLFTPNKQEAIQAMASGATEREK